MCNQIYIKQVTQFTRKQKKRANLKRFIIKSLKLTSSEIVTFYLKSTSRARSSPRAVCCPPRSTTIIVYSLILTNRKCLLLEYFDLFLGEGLCEYPESDLNE